MSRSTKKPYFTCKQNYRTKGAKRKATRKVRKSKEVSSGGAYKKFSESWDINDWSFYTPNQKKAYRK